MSLVEDTGFDAIDGGPLAESWRHQPITGAYCTELTRSELQKALAVPTVPVPHSGASRWSRSSWLSATVTRPRTSSVCTGPRALKAGSVATPNENKISDAYRRR
jgi:hypothetical protein